MMVLGLISDIHAHADALQQALDLLQAHGAEKVLCMGDLVEKGSQGNAVIDLIRQYHIPCVRGNHDDVARSNQRWMQENADPQWLDDHPPLTAVTLDFVESLPLTRRYVWEGQRVLMVHGTPQSNSDYLLPTTPPKTYKRIAAAIDADVMLYGHTHRPLYRTYKGVRFINPGSVVPLNTAFAHNSGTCATLSLPDYTLRVFRITTGERLTLPR